MPTNDASWPPRQPTVGALLGPYRLHEQPEHKRHAVLEGGHLPPDIHAVMREILTWLDRYLGPTESGAASQ